LVNSFAAWLAALSGKQTELPWDAIAVIATNYPIFRSYFAVEGLLAVEIATGEVIGFDHLASVSEGSNKCFTRI